MSEQDRVLDHDYDGIQEYDNRLPNWWLYTLYGAIVFALGYWIYYQTFSVGRMPVQNLVAANAKAARLQLERMGEAELTDESLTLVSQVPERVTAGRAVFTQFCVVCHGEQGQGNVGPNLTDGYWIHGAAPTNIWTTVTNGVPAKGMAAWGNQLGPARVQDVVAYVLTIRNTNVPGKAPEGTPAGETGGG